LKNDGDTIARGKGKVAKEEFRTASCLRETKGLEPIGEGTLKGEGIITGGKGGDSRSQALARKTEGKRDAGVVRQPIGNEEIRCKTKRLLGHLSDQRGAKGKA